MRAALTILASLVLFGSFDIAFAEEKESPPPYDRTITEKEALNIAEATFRYQFQHNDSGAQQDAKAYFLSLFGKDPSPDFLKLFAASKIPVKNGSEFKVGKGLEFRVSSIKRIDKMKVEASGGYYEGNLSSSGCTYTLELKDKKWVVTKREMEWIS